MSEPGANVPVMEAATWTAIGLLGGALVAFFGSFYYLGSRIDGLGSGSTGRARGPTVSVRRSTVSARRSTVSAPASTPRSTTSVRGLDARIDAMSLDLGGRIDALTTRALRDGCVNALNARMDEHLRHTG